MGKKRAELRWTKSGPEEDEEYMYSLLPDYHRILAAGNGKSKNPEKKAWLRARLADYKLRYAGRVETWDLTGIGRGGTVSEREAKYYLVRNTLLIMENVELTL